MRGNIAAQQTLERPLCQVTNERYFTRMDSIYPLVRALQCSTCQKYGLHRVDEQGINAPQCITCENHPKPEKVEEDIDYYAKIRNLAHTQKRRYQVVGITPRDYERMLTAQNGVCAICGKKETAKRKGIEKLLAVDHDHITGTVRSLLCSKCNIALGLLGEDPERIRALLAYTEKWQS